MKKILSFLILGMLVLGGLGAAATTIDHRQKSSQNNNRLNSPYVDELDQSMTDFDGSLSMGRTNLFGFYANLSVAQSFIPQKKVLTRAQFLMARNTSTSKPCVLAVRDNLTGANLAITSMEPSEFPIVNGTPTEDQLTWINFNFNDIWVTPGQTYYLVMYTTNITDNYYWISGNGTNRYLNGTVMLSIDNGNTWAELPNADGCFKTYGLRETFLNITMKNSLFGPTFIIKNVGNYTAWDVTWNYTISGGFLLFYKAVIGNLSELLPGDSITLKSGFFIGFGNVIISLKVSAANVHEYSIQKNAKIFFFIIIIPPV
jgi:hypothetical protein